MSSKTPGEGEAQPKKRSADQFAWSWLRAIRDLPPFKGKDGLVAMAAVLVTYMDADGTRCFPGDERLQHDLGVGRSTVQHRLLWMERLGWVLRDTRPVPTGNGYASDRLIVPCPPSEWTDDFIGTKPVKKSGSDDCGVQPPGQPAPDRLSGTPDSPVRPPGQEDAEPVQPSGHHLLYGYPLIDHPNEGTVVDEGSHQEVPAWEPGSVVGDLAIRECRSAWDRHRVYHPDNDEWMPPEDEQRVRDRIGELIDNGVDQRTIALALSGDFPTDRRVGDLAALLVKRMKNVHKSAGMNRRAGRSRPPAANEFGDETRVVNDF